MPEQEIDALRERWEADRSPVLTLQLADEYKAREEAVEALAVLAAGVEANPEHVATRVAKGRYHLEVGEVSEATADLERVALEDPAHLLVNKLLVDAYTRQGNLARARDRLDLYALLSSGDPALAEMEERLAAAASRGGDAPEETPELAAPADEGATEEPAEVAAPSADVVLEEPTGLAAAVAEEATPDLVEPPVEPLPALTLPDAEELPVELAGLAVPLAEESLEPRSELATPGSGASLPEPDPPAASPEPSESEPFDLPAPSLPQALTVAAAAQGLGAHAARVEIAADSEPFSFDWIPMEESSYRAAIFDDGLFAAAPAVAPPLPAAAEDHSQDLAATLTLAELYRKQGHDREALGIFREVLERQPGNARAARALRELEVGQSWPLTAGDLLGEEGSGGSPGGPSAKGDLLRRYRDRLRPKE